MILEYHDLRDLCFWVIGRVLAGLKLKQVLMHTKLPIISSYKNSFFLFAWFSKNLREFANQKSYGQLPEKAWSNGLFDFFQKLCPSRHQDFLFKWFQGENECLLGLPTMTTNSFENPITKTLKPFFLFIFFCADFMIMTFFPLFRNVNKIRNDKKRPK